MCDEDRALPILPFRIRRPRPWDLVEGRWLRMPAAGRAPSGGCAAAVLLLPRDKPHVVRLAWSAVEEQERCDLVWPQPSGVAW